MLRFFAKFKLYSKHFYNLQKYFLLQYSFTIGIALLYTYVFFYIGIF